jgi:hypothetical protein
MIPIQDLRNKVLAGLPLDPIEVMTLFNEIDRLTKLNIDLQGHLDRLTAQQPVAQSEEKLARGGYF